MKYRLSAIALGVRLLLILWGHIQDHYFTVKYTDIDYQVFTDAARHVVQGESPYQRPTYRYTPLLAWILTPNIWLNANFGKLAFSIVDIINGLLIFGDVDARFGSRAALTSMSLWLFNPITLVVSTRGNAETLITLSVLLTLYFHRRHAYLACGLALGLAVHLKIYPVIYSIVLYFGASSFTTTFLQCFLPNWNRVKLVTGSILVLAVANSFFYYLYGWPFVFETYLYHVTRQDVRHNFSPYFYLLYLHSEQPSAPLVSLLAFLPQALIVLILSWRYRSRDDLSWALFVLTFGFVTFNKVVTSQYFLWYLSLLPLCLPELEFSRKKSALLTVAWLGTQAVWLFFAYLLEFRGLNVFIYVWMASLLFFATNIWIMTEAMKARRHRSVTLEKKAT